SLSFPMPRLRYPLCHSTFLSLSLPCSMRTRSQDDACTDDEKLSSLSHNPVSTPRDRLSKPPCPHQTEKHRGMLCIEDSPVSNQSFSMMMRPYRDRIVPDL